MSLILEKFNLSGFRWLNDLAGHNSWLDRLMVFTADQMGYFLIVFVLILFWKRNDFKKIIFVSFGSAIVSRFVFVTIIRYFVHSPRPFLVLENVHKLVSNDLESSFPSGHASFYFALATAVYLYNNRAKPSSGLYGHKKSGYIYLILAGLMGVARIFVGVHWPLDIVTGAGLGIFTAYIMERFVGRYLL